MTNWKGCGRKLPWAVLRYLRFEVLTAKISIVITEDPNLYFKILPGGPEENHGKPQDNWFRG
jgi:hypothetical protein